METKNQNKKMNPIDRDLHELADKEDWTGLYLLLDSLIGDEEVVKKKKEQKVRLKMRGDKNKLGVDK